MNYDVVFRSYGYVFHGNIVLIVQCNIQLSIKELQYYHTLCKGQKDLRIRQNSPQPAAISPVNNVC